MEQANKYQKQNVNQMLDERENFKQMIQSAKTESNDRIEQTDAEGYSSMEIPEPKVEAAAVEEEAAPEMVEENELAEETVVEEEEVEEPKKE